MSAAVVSFQRNRPMPMRARRCTVKLHYPEQWAVRPNPLAVAMEQRALAWLRLTGEEEARLRSYALGELANWPFPFADEQRAEVITKLMALRLVDRDGSELDAALAAVMSQEWMTRYKAGRAASGGATVREHLTWRRERLGVSGSIDLIAYQLGWEVPAEVLADPDMRGVEEAAGECVAIARDLFGFTGDAAAGLPNTVTGAMAEFGDSVGEAFKWVTHMHARQVRELRQREAALLARYPQHPMLTAWFDALHCMIYGFTQWHARAPRYAAVHETGGMTVQVAVSPACPDPF